MKLKNIKIGIFVFCILLSSCISRIYQDILNQEDKKMKNKQYEVLLNIASDYINAKQSTIKDIERRKGYNL